MQHADRLGLQIAVGAEVEAEFDRMLAKYPRGAA
jgi:hypothetical protein